MALHWKILAPLAVVWLLMAAYLHWYWVPRAVAQKEMQYHDAVAGSLQRLAQEVGPLVKAGRSADADILLQHALRADPSWTVVELRDQVGKSTRRLDGVARTDAAAAEERSFEQPVTDGAAVLGWVAARVDLAPGLASIRAAQREIYLLLLVGLAIALAATGIATRLLVGRPLERLAASVKSLADGGSEPLPDAGRGDEVGRVSASLAEVRDAMGRRSRELERELERRRQVEERLHESEERYVLAVRGADDGLWEWDLRSGKVHYSPRWKSMLGYTEDEIGDDVGEWRSRIHPDDLQPTMTAVQAHLDGTVERFENDHRLRHKNGRYRWVLARGATLRSASGKPYRLVGLNTDITARKRAEEVLLSLAEGLASVRGDEFFRALVRNFARVLGVKYAFIAECVDYPTTRVRKLASWKNDAWAEANEFDLAGTPCHETIELGRVCVYSRNVGLIYPREVGWESYLGIPIFDSAGTVMGHLACYDSEPAQDDLPVQSIFSLFAVRAGVEMERRALEQRLQALTAARARG
ncbi:MAG: PAS domain-containing protein [Burkholderiales bacterium]